ncbi:MAG: extracellular solute-binding protein [Candidatus Levybacteria bacterium]|nr:extracellular solute-binding protein [Candidatus Levybacteria bacterium]
MENDQTVFQSPQPPGGQMPPLPGREPLNNPLPQNPPDNPPPPLSGPPPTAPQEPKPSNENKRKLPVRGLLRILIGAVVVLIVVSVIFFAVNTLFGGKSNTATGGELTFWGLWEDEKTMKAVIDDFQRQNPSIKVKYEKQDVKQYRETLQTRIDNGNGPDIFLFHNSWYPMLSSILLPFPSKTISKDEYLNSFYPVVQKDLIQNGAIYGVPMSIDTLAMYVNKDIFSSAGLVYPKTWNDFVDFARILTVKDEEGKIKTAGAAMGTFDNISHASDIVSLLFLQNSVDLADMESSRDRALGALNFYTSFATDVNNVWDITLDPSILAFSKGNLAMFFGYSWDYFTIKAFNPNLNFEITTVPQLPNQSINMASYWASGVSAKSTHQKEALMFVSFLAQRETEEKMYLEQSKERTFGEPYARVDLAATASENPLVYPFLTQAPTAGSSFFVDATYDNGLNQQLNTYLGNAINSIYNAGSTESAFDTLTEGMTQVLSQYGQ